MKRRAEVSATESLPGIIGMLRRDHVTKRRFAPPERGLRQWVIPKDFSPGHLSPASS
ncbi:MAG: hypothetical protein V2G51_01230 [bacterium JZ-2024 1]